VLFPTPPFADDTATILETLGILRLVGKPRCALGRVGDMPFRGRPCVVSFSLPVHPFQHTRGFSWLRHLEPVEKHLRIFKIRIARLGLIEWSMRWAWRLGSYVWAAIHSLRLECTPVSSQTLPQLRVSFTMDHGSPLQLQRLLSPNQYL
jgi:hypothetical protein